jgi:hypothetical protein
MVVGLDGVGRLPDGARVAFFGSQPPYGGMAEQALVRRGMWLPVPDGIDDVTAAAVTNPGMAAWKTLLWEGELAPGQTVLVLGATGTSGRIATQLATRRGARVVAAGRNQRVLVQLMARGADAMIRVDRLREELAGGHRRRGTLRPDRRLPLGRARRGGLRRADPRGPTRRRRPGRIRYIQVGIGAGDVATLPAMTLRSAPVQLFGSGIGGQAALGDAAAAYDDLLRQVAAGEISLDIDPEPLAQVEQVWPRAGSDRRIVFVP